MLMYMRKALNPNSYIDKQYIPRKATSKGLMSAEDVVSHWLSWDMRILLRFLVIFFLTDASRVDRDLEARSGEPVTVAKKQFKKKWHDKLKKRSFIVSFYQQ